MFANSTTWSLLADYTEEYAWFPEAASTFANDIDWLFWFISIVCLVFFIPIAGALFYFAVKYNKPKGEKAESNTSHNTPLELAWSIGPSFFLVGMFVLGAKSYLDHRTVPDGAYDVGVQAFKWGWTMDYGRGTFHPELHILLDEPTKLSMRSSDVIHSLYVPAFRAKKDIVPGRYNYMWFKPTVASTKVSDQRLQKAKTKMEGLGQGWDYDELQFTPDGYSFFDLYCTEYCGKNHSEMQTVVVVHETLDDLNAWIKKYSKRGPDVDPATYGEALYERRGCAGCHSVDGSKRVGPSFQESYGNQRPLANGESVLADENYIRESILYPKEKVVAGYQPAMPSYKGQLSDDDIYCLIEYLKTVSDYYTPEEPAAEEQASEDATVGADEVEPSEENEEGTDESVD
ncbi:MAG: cytochrome c oxidase subunit II [Planctomycetota bacterium]